MDGQQHRAEKEAKQKIRLPVVHLPQLVGLALGIDEKKLGFKRHIVSCKGFLGKIGKEEKKE
jgi:succinate dehydrogenase / fumarate reductase cytochrome b subunit